MGAYESRQGIADKVVLQRLGFKSLSLSVI